MIQTQQQLQATFCDNFVAYFRSHMAHVNVVGRNFDGDHTLLGEVYEYLQGKIDVLAELIRTTGDFAPNNLMSVVVDADIADEPVLGTADDFLETVRDNLVMLVNRYRELAEAASDDEAEEIENFAQEEVLALNKLIWKFDATLTP